MCLLYSEFTIPTNVWPGYLKSSVNSLWKGRSGCFRLCADIRQNQFTCVAVLFFFIIIPVSYFLCFLSLQSSNSNMFIGSRKFWLTSSSVIRRGTPVWTKRTQSLHRLKRNRGDSAPGRRESSLYWSRRLTLLCWLLLMRKVTTSSSLTTLMSLRVKISVKASMETGDQLERQKPEVPVIMFTNLTGQKCTVMLR